ARAGAMRARPQWHRQIDVTERALRLSAAAGRRDPFGRATVAVHRGARDEAAPRRLSAAAPEHLSVSQRRGELAAGRLALPRRAPTRWRAGQPSVRTIPGAA